MSQVRPTRLCDDAGRQRRVGGPKLAGLRSRADSPPAPSGSGLAPPGTFGPALRAALGPVLCDLAENTCVRVGVADAADPHPVARAALIAIVLDAVTTAVRHRQPRAVEVSITAAGSGWHLTVRDDGPGFAVAARRYGDGGGAMADHARAAGGTLQVRSEPGRGTLVEAVLP